MNRPPSDPGSSTSAAGTPAWLVPLKILAWPFVFLGKTLYKHWLSYLFGRVLRDDRRIYSIKFIWYGDAVYLHPLVWGSVVLYFVHKAAEKGELFSVGWPLLTWFIMSS